MAQRQQPWQWEEVAAIYLLLGAATAGGLLGGILFLKATPKHEWAWTRTPEMSVSERAFGNEPEWPGEAPAGWPPPVLVMRWDEWGCSNTLAIGPSGSDNDPRNHYAMEVRHYGCPRCAAGWTGHVRESRDGSWREGSRRDRPGERLVHVSR